MIVVGTDIASYQLTDALRNSRHFQPLFILNEEPWHHKTYILEAQLRYASELIALVERNKIKAVLCVCATDYATIRDSFSPELNQRGCQILLVEGNRLPDRHLME
ncbi:hypothetical protein GCM10011338_09610 [Alteromonas lipolytica]|nr:hypothetical protein GCM10011338_09610 [Alteromonas lipolytica]